MGLLPGFAATGTPSGPGPHQAGSCSRVRAQRFLLEALLLSSRRVPSSAVLNHVPETKTSGTCVCLLQIPRDLCNATTVPTALLALYFGHRCSYNRAKFLPVPSSQTGSLLYGKRWFLSCTYRGATHVELGDTGAQHVGGGLGTLPSDAVTCEQLCLAGGYDGSIPILVVFHLNNLLSSKGLVGIGSRQVFFGRRQLECYQHV